MISCANSPPTCSAAETAYRVCSDGSVWECPQGTQAQLTAKRMITDACAQEADPVKCTFNAKFEMFPMNAIAKCEEGGQVCKESIADHAKTAVCQPQ